MATHRGAVNRLLWAARTYPVGPSDTVLQKASLSFDFSVWESFGSLLAGARLVLARPGGQRDPAYLVEAIRRQRVTMLHFVPSMLQAFVAADGLEACDSLRFVFSGGEALPASVVEHHARRLPSVPLRNQYGPTEITIDVTERVFDGPPEGGAVPIGRPLANAALHVVDPHGRPQPAGVAGELWVGGVGVTRGYHGRPALTAERFVPDPFGSNLGARLYRTGDRVLWSVRGELEFQGRIDQQVQLRGFRIELGEVEAALADHPAVREVAVAVRGDRLVAYVVTENEPEDLLALARTRLPEHMVPSVVVTLDALPLTPSGKLDRRALPEPTLDRGALATGYVPPASPVESLVAGIWEEVLGHERVGAADDFFALGGHSLLATQVVARLRRALGAEVPVRALFEGPTVRELARSVERARREGATGGAAAGPPLEPMPRTGPPPLSFAQERLWFLDRLDPGGSTYNIATALHVDGALSAAALARTLTGLVERHEVLRTRYEEIDGVPVQRIDPPAPMLLPVVDLTGLPTATRTEQARRLARAEGRRPFDLGRGPVLRASLLRLAESEHLATVTLHHIASDGWSMRVLLHEVATLYDGGGELPTLPVQYADFALWQRGWLTGETLAAEVGYWRERLAEVPPVLDLPTDRPRPASPSHRGATRRIAVGAETTAALRRFARARGVTPFMVLLAAWQAVLGRQAGQDLLAVGTPIAGRRHVEVEGLIGFFVNTLVLRGDLAADPGFGALVSRVREEALGAHEHQDLPFERLVEELDPERSLAHTPLFQVMFALQNLPARTVEAGELRWQPVAAGGGTEKFDLSLTLVEEGDDVVGALSYATDLFDVTTAERLAARFTSILAAALDAPDRPLSELPWIDRAERHRLLQEWNDTASDPLPEDRLDARIRDRARRTPDAVAVVFEDHQLSYRELMRRAARLGGHLRALGIGPERGVGVYADRSIALAVGLLGVLESGGYYVPLDPGYPEERLAYMVEDAGVSLVLAPAAGAERACPTGCGRVVDARRGGRAVGEVLEAPDRHPTRRPPTTWPTPSTPPARPAARRGCWSTTAGWSTGCGGRTGPTRSGGRRGAPEATLIFDASVWEIFEPL